MSHSSTTGKKKKIVQRETRDIQEGGSSGVRHDKPDITTTNIRGDHEGKTPQIRTDPVIFGVPHIRTRNRYTVMQPRNEENLEFRGNRTGASIQQNQTAETLNIWGDKEGNGSTKMWEETREELNTWEEKGRGALNIWEDKEGEHSTSVRI